ncbi:hypothetical protein pipiens_009450 [Culex pipiens pipiens]|uniref:Uncharacterized protein n=1 Tax=Culex pipiens pipiens TaxID=38569 RepID=A0ABD1DDS1_CULPP
MDRLEITQSAFHPATASQVWVTKANQFLSELCPIYSPLGKLVEDYCISPTFICGHPQIMSPLAILPAIELNDPAV